MATTSRDDDASPGQSCPRVVTLRGTPCDMGRQQGRVLFDEIRNVLEQSGESPETHPATSGTVAAADSQAEAFFGPAELQELHGVSEAAGVELHWLLMHNLRLYRDAGGGGIHFALSADVNGNYGLLHGVNEDLRQNYSQQRPLQRIVFVRHPQDGIPHATFGVAGQVGGLNGINARGLTISTTALLDLDGAPAPLQGRLHTVLVKNMLEAAADVDSAVDIFKQDPGCTPYTLCLTHFPADRLCHIEYDLNLLKVLPWTPDVIGANHRVMRTFPGEPPAPLLNRYLRLRRLLGGEVPTPLSSLQAFHVLRDHCDPATGRPLGDPTSETLCRDDNQVSVLFDPARGALWVTTGSHARDSRDVFCEFKLRELFPEYAKLGAQSEPAMASGRSRTANKAVAEPKTPASVASWQSAPVADDVEAATAEKPDPQPAIGASATLPSLPLIDAVPELVPGERVVAESRLDPATDVFLLQHRFKGRPMLPLVVMVEALTEAAALLARPKQRVVAVRDVEVLDGLRFGSDEVHTVRISAVAHGSGVECQLNCDVRNRQGKLLLKDKPRMRATVQLAGPDGGHARLTPSVVAAAPSRPTDWVRCFYTENIVIYHGPVFRCLRALAVDGAHSWGHIVSVPIAELNGRRQGGGWTIHPAMLDACLYACGSTLWLKQRGVIAVPHGIEQLCIGRFPRPNEKCLVTMLDRGRHGNQTCYDFSATGEDGQLLFDVHGYCNTIVAEEPAAAAAAPTAD